MKRLIVNSINLRTFIHSWWIFDLKEHVDVNIINKKLSLVLYSGYVFFCALIASFLPP